MAKRKTKKPEKSDYADVVTITISRACAEELYVAIANSLTSQGGGKGGVAPLGIGGLPGDNDTPGNE